MNQEFWNSLEKLIQTHAIKIDRQQGSQHPRYPEYIYPFGYGHIEGTTSSDGAEIDCWVGNLDHEPKVLNGIIVTLDTEKFDSEIKVLINCADTDMETILECHN